MRDTGSPSGSDSCSSCIYLALSALYIYAGITAVILFNVCIIVIETDEEAKCYPLYKDRVSDCPTSGASIEWLVLTNWVLRDSYSPAP